MSSLFLLYTGSFVFAVTVSDDDEGPNAELQYSLTGRNAERFQIDPSRGAIMAAQKLTGGTDITITVNVKDRGMYPMSDSTTVTVRFGNEADFPQINAGQQSFTFPEDQKIDTYITTVSASSKRSPVRGSLSYYIASGNLGDVFHIDQLTGKLVLKKSLDFEAVQKYVLWIEARDMGYPPYSSYKQLNITVLDVNDNAPVFKQNPFMANVMENTFSHKIITVVAEDKDSGPSGQIEYTILDGNRGNNFNINRETGEIRNTKRLDREKEAQYTLTVQATDKGPSSSSSVCHVIVNVLDENDNAPRFSQIFSAQVSENAAIGYTVTRVTTSDEDTGVNAISQYSIRDVSLPFSINAKTGDITVSRPLNREDVERYTVKVYAHDSGWTVNTDITVFVTDVNDNAPRFTQPSYYLDYPELTEIGSSVTQVVATDPDNGLNGQVFYFIKSQSEFFRINSSTGELNATDADSGANAVIAYAIESSDSDLFVIDPNTGVITTQGFLDFEVKQSYQMYVKAFNVPDEDHFSFANVYVQLSGVNEYVPRFVSRQYSFEVSEAASKGTTVGEVFASDRDLGTDGVVTYLLVGKSRSKGLRIDKKTGQIYVSGQLDREKEEKISLRVLAKNAGSIRGFDVDEVCVNITILDANDPPVFTSEEYNVQINEGAAPGAHVIFVSAFDSDSVPSWSRFTYHIGVGNEKGAFSIDSQTGQVSVAAELDRESIPIYNLSILAVDSGVPSATGSTYLLVNLEDINDNGPTLISTTGEVVENQRAGAVVMTLNATDPDLPPNQGPFTYHLLSTGPATSYFSLSSVGILTTTREIDREQISDFHLSVVTRDSGTPQMSSTTGSLALDVAKKRVSVEGWHSGSVVASLPHSTKMWSTKNLGLISASGDCLEFEHSPCVCMGFHRVL
eukprot:g46287.t1